MKPEIVDSHCHLDFPDFEDCRAEVIGAAVETGVTRMVTICTKLRQLPGVIEIAESYEPVFFAAGTHPMNVAEEGIVTVENLTEISRHPKMVGIGETGLDYHYTSESRDLQIESLKVHIEASRQTRLPLIIHSRAADEDMAQILEEEHKKGRFSCVMHCFSSSAELAKTALDLGFYLSMSGIVTFKKSVELREIFRNAPVERLLVETDSPYLAPTPFRGKRNEPAFTTHTAKMGAEIFDMSYEDFAAQTTDNFNRLFSKASEWRSAA